MDCSSSSSRCYRTGDAVEVLDGESSWSAKILEISQSSALVHFLKFNARHDEWIPLERLRARREDHSPMGGPWDAKEFKVGEKVMAPWKYGRKYPGVVLAKELKGYKVKFYDGVTVCGVKPSTMRYLRKEEDCQEDEDQREPEEEDDEGEEEDSGREASGGRRERKSKFNIKDLLNVRRPRRSRGGKEEEGAGEDETEAPSKQQETEESTQEEDTGFKKPSSKKDAAMEASGEASSSKRKASKQSSGTSSLAKKETPSSSSVKKSSTSSKPKKEDAKKHPSRKGEVHKSFSSSKVSHEVHPLKKKKKESGGTSSSSKDVSKKLKGSHGHHRKVAKSGGFSKCSSPSLLHHKASDSEKESAKKTLKSSEANVSSKNEEAEESASEDCTLDKDGSPEASPSPSVSDKNDKEDQDSPSKAEEDEKKSAKMNCGSATPKPRITEPLLKEGPPITLVTGKRERKRKKFWDEEEDPPPSGPPPKASKRLSSSSSTSELASTSNTRRSSCAISSGESSSKTPSSSKSSRQQQAPKVKFKTEADVKGGGRNGKKLEYLLFDMSLEPKLIAKQMIEGYNIPGPGEPIPVDSSNLPDGWEKRVIQRGLGVTRGKWDVFIQNAAGKSFRSKTELQKHFDENNLNYSLDSFDFSLDDNLKRLRQIWKQYVIKPNLKPGETMSSLLAAKFSRKSAKHSKDSSVLSSLNSNRESSYLPRASGVHPNKDNHISSSSSGTTGVASGPKSLSSLPTTSPSSLESPGVVSETGQGLRCKINKCGKLFRNDKLLLMHVKHYHPEFRESIPPVSIVPLGVGEDLESPGPTPKRRLDSTSVSAPPEKKLKTLLPELDRRTSTEVLESDHSHVTMGRKRNDSSLSVGSGCTTDGERNAPSSPNPAKPSKGNHHQRKHILPGSKKCSGSFSTVPEELVLLGGSGALEDSNSEMDASSTCGADHLTSEEVVNCTCRRLEEDGLMIQCDLCLCWQHGACLGIFEEDQVPEKHICSVCKNPPRCRHAASRTLIDQDLLKEGKMIRLPGSSDSSSTLSPGGASARQDAFRKLSDLMSDLMGLSKVLHSLRVKISVASQKNSSKVFMWSSPWDSPHQPPPAKGDQQQPPLVLDPVSLMSELNGFKESVDLGEDSIIDPSMIPSVSEVQELLPSIIEAEGLLQGTHDEEEAPHPPPQPPPMPNLIPEPPKRIDKDESRINLIQHINDVQCEVEERLNILEDNLASLEKEDEYSELTIYDAVNANCAKTKAIIQMLLMDLSTGKTMMGSV